MVEKGGEVLGLQLINKHKSEIIGRDSNSILYLLPSASVMVPKNATLLGSFIGNLSAINHVLVKKTHVLRVMDVRL